MKSIYTGMLRKVLQWVGKINKKKVFDIINEIKRVDKLDIPGTEKALEVAKFINESIVPFGHKWVINLLVEGVFAYATIKGMLDDKK